MGFDAAMTLDIQLNLQHFLKVEQNLKRIANVRTVFIVFKYAWLVSANHFINIWLE